MKLAAHELEIAESTAKTHLSRLYRRIGVTDRGQAVAWMDDHYPGWRRPSRAPARPRVKRDFVIRSV